jgi:rSAM/selenodomain-associated transferase 2
VIASVDRHEVAGVSGRPGPAPPWLTVVIPAMNEAVALPRLLEAMAPWRMRGVEVIVVDGGSRDATAELARGHCDQVLVQSPGRACQMNAGARAARGAVLLFLHADTHLPEDAVEAIRSAVGPGADLDRRLWGRFDVRIVGRPRMLPVIAWCMNRRSRWTGIATGDQAIFVRREAFEAVGGFPEQPLMEDIELSRRLRRLGPPACLRGPAETSGRRWESRGVWRTILLMWSLRWAYWRGSSPEDLARRYR